MGVENGLLSDLQIVVSSVLDDRPDFYGKHNIRLNTQPDSFLSAGAWVAEPKPEQYVRVGFALHSICLLKLCLNVVFFTEFHELRVLSSKFYLSLISV